MIDLAVDNKNVVLDYFNKINRDSYRTSKGIFLGSPLDSIVMNIDFLLSNNYLRRSVFLDAGSGDGRVSLLVAAVYGWESFGIEFEDSLVKKSLAIKEELSFSKGLDLSSLKFAKGDFCDDAVYSSMGLSFSDVDLFFNFNNGIHPLIHKIASDSPSGTKLLFYGFNHSYSFEGFKNLISIRNYCRHNKDGLVTACYQSSLFNKKDFQFSSDIFYAHLFEKL